MRPLDRRSIGVISAVTMAVATFAQVVFSALSSYLIDEFDVERWQIGALVTATGVTGAVLSPWFGRVTDRIGAVRATRGVLLTGAVFLFLIAGSPSYPVLAAVAVLNGISQGWGNPATNALIVENIEAGRRGTITGIKQSGVQMGTFLGGLLLAPLASLWNWRLAIAVFLVVPLLALAATRGRPRAETARLAGDARPGRVPLGVRWVAVYGALSGLGSSAIFTFLPLFAQEDQGWSPGYAGLLLAGVGLVGIAARIAWGSLSERLLGHGRTLRAIAVISTASAVLLAGVAADLMPSWVLVPAAVLFGAGAISWNSVGMLAVMDFSPVGLVGRGTGLVLLGFLLGLGTGAPLLGLAVDRLGTYTAGWVAVGFLFVACAGIAGRITRTGTLAAT